MRLDEKHAKSSKARLPASSGRKPSRACSEAVQMTHNAAETLIYSSIRAGLWHTRIQAECRLSARLYIRLGGRKVDVLIKYPLKPPLPIHEQALRNGIIL